MIKSAKPHIKRLGAFALAVLVTGCISVTSDPDNPTRLAIEETGQVTWRAGPGLSRDEVGMEADRDAAIYDSLDQDQSYRATISLPDGTTLDQTVKYVAAWADSPEVGVGDPCRITLNHGLLSADEADSLLSDYQGSLGLDQQQVALWREHHDAVVADGDGGTLPRSLFFIGTPNGDVSSTVEAGTNRGTGSASILVELTWCLL